MSIHPQIPTTFSQRKKVLTLLSPTPLPLSLSVAMLFQSTLHIPLLVLGLVSNTLALVAPRAVADCPTNGFQSGRKCIPYVENKDIAGIKFSLYTWTDRKAPASPVADPKYLKPLQSAAAKALPVYADLMQTKVKTVRVYLTEEDGTIRGATDYHELDPTICNVRVIGSGDGPSSDIESVQQTLAHELYHCVQRTFGMEQPFQDDSLPNNWWFEGSAEYFGNFFFPDTKPDHMQKYDPASPLYNQKHDFSYPGSLFFQHLSNVFTSNKEIHDWVVSRKSTTSSTLQDERRWLSSDSFITKPFPSFATAFKDDLILYSNGEPVPRDFKVNLHTPACTLSDKPGVYDTKTFTRPWTIWETLDVALPDKRDISFKYTVPSGQGSNVVLQYSKDGEKSWKTAGKGATVKVDCGSKKYTYLATSTGNGDVKTSVPVTIEFTVKKKKKGSNKHKAKRDETDGDLSTSEGLEYNPRALRAADTRPREIIVVSLDNDDGDDDDDDEGDSCSTDKCIVGDWNLDVPSMQAFLSEQLSASDVAISNVAVTGSSSFSVKKDLSSAMTFKGLDIAYDGSAGGYDFHTLIDITGSVDGTLKLGKTAAGGDSFTWTNVKSQGLAKTTTTIAGFDDPTELDISLDQQYGSDTQVHYTCTDKTLQMSGYVDSKFTWAYTWTRETVA
ncbi:hypothetical protein AYO20_04303 [Fonsecaea nubica]|uniref:Uncharacterized protein n=1 Tax=Fonsecaea nubica TaxID=856822 RepID=A0A178D3Y4_9EURO|nr:hypothetical protein AYO20_04303 [Fonsecaea nubica]OAL36407.1 hypothetical protein AYO20_04303 [Fonsecaea nubica]